ncbi:putative toxin-antitoxin system toxin component, PIN family [Acidithiobacillus sp. YTS05]|nr:putative toxin-antitoxin system toxin component, PIN family [Igneacidithiobacillus copahuensis]UTV79992.1 putative toxin-antitoxin system toxin component, PIN family [Acidithiobacillus sp. YTS05]
MKAYMLSSMVRIVIDTNVFVVAMRAEGGASREILRRALHGRYIPLFGNALWLEYEDVLGQPLWTQATTDGERRAVMAALASREVWISIYYGWRPNLADEGDNHLIELAIAGSAAVIITHNVADLRGGEMRWPGLHILKPSECLEKFS